MKSLFDSKFFANNRQRLLNLSDGTYPIVITANGLLQRGADSTFAFSQDANFWYLTGIDEPDIILVIDGAETYLIVPGRSDSRQAFDGSISYTNLSRRSGIQNVYDEAEGWRRLQKRLKQTTRVATVPAPPIYVEAYGMYTNPARAALVARLNHYNSELQQIDISPHLTSLRVIKQVPEIKALQSAIDITTDSIREATRGNKLGDYTHEYQIEAELSRGFRRLGARGHGFEPIVAGGKRACTLHYVTNNSTLSPGELLLIDTGAEVEHYSADITRTLAIGQPSKRQIEVHSAVLEVQKFALGMIKPGLVLSDYEHQIQEFMGDKLKQLGLIKRITHASVRQFYPHGTSHFLGLNVHDVGDHRSNVSGKRDQPHGLEPNMVLTVEPGIYIPKEGIGVRIEDDVLVTKDGNKCLSDKLLRGLSLE